MSVTSTYTISTVVSNNHFNIICFFTIYAVPPPSLSITSTSSGLIVSKNTSNTSVFLAGSSLTITCDITVTLSVNDNFTALVQWSLKLAFDFTTAGSGESANVLSTMQATKIASNHYQSQLTIPSLDRIKHTGNYTCAVRLASSDALLFVKDSNSSSVSTTVEIYGITNV